MPRTSTTVACLLLALCLFPLRVAASDEEVWMESARRDAQADHYRLISVKDLAKLLDEKADTVIIDARADYEFEAGHIPTAKNFEFDLGDRTDLSADKRTAYENLLGPDKKRMLVIYCRSFR